jgi:alkylmercury lyase
VADAAVLEDQVRHTAFALLVRDGRPVVLQQLEASLPVDVDRAQTPDAVERLAASGHLDLDPSGAVVGAAGLTLADAPHRLLLHGRDYRTWCAYDAIGIPAALGVDGAISTRCGVCGRAIAVRLPAAAAEDRPERLWLAAGGTDLRADFCTPTVLLCSPEHADAWAERRGRRGRVLDLRQAWRLGAGAWGTYAREAARLGMA